MDSKKIRRVIGILILLISLAVLLWGVLPAAVEVRILPISPIDMQLPGSESFLSGVIWI